MKIVCGQDDVRVVYLQDHMKTDWVQNATIKNENNPLNLQSVNVNEDDLVLQCEVELLEILASRQSSDNERFVTTSFKDRENKQDKKKKHLSAIQKKKRNHKTRNQKKKRKLEKHLKMNRTEKVVHSAPRDLPFLHRLQQGNIFGAQRVVENRNYTERLSTFLSNQAPNRRYPDQEPESNDLQLPNSTTGNSTRSDQVTNCVLATSSNDQPGPSRPSASANADQRRVVRPANEEFPTGPSSEEIKLLASFLSDEQKNELISLVLPVIAVMPPYNDLQLPNSTTGNSTRSDQVTNCVLATSSNDRPGPSRPSASANADQRRVVRPANEEFPPSYSSEELKLLAKFLSDEEKNDLISLVIPVIDVMPPYNDLQLPNSTTGNSTPSDQVTNCVLATSSNDRPGPSRPSASANADQRRVVRPANEEFPPSYSSEELKLLAKFLSDEEKNDLISLVIPVIDVMPPSSPPPPIPPPPPLRKKIAKKNIRTKVTAVNRKIKEAMVKYSNVYSPNPVVESLNSILTGDILNNIYDNWNSSDAIEIQKLLLLLIFNLHNRVMNIVPLIGCLMTIFRTTCSTSRLTAIETYNKFKIFIDVIKYSVRIADVQFWKTWMTPDSFLFACYFIDYELFRDRPDYTFMKHRINWTKTTAFHWYLKTPMYLVPEPKPQTLDSYVGRFKNTMSRGVQVSIERGPHV